MGIVKTGPLSLRGVGFWRPAPLSPKNPRYQGKVYGPNLYGCGYQVRVCAFQTGKTFVMHQWRPYHNGSGRERIRQLFKRQGVY